MELSIAKEGDRETWDAIVKDSPQGTLFHRWDFLKIVERYSGAKFYPVMGCKEGSYTGIYPLFYRKTPLVRTVFSPQPHLAVFYLGPAMAEDKITKRSTKAARFTEFHEKVDAYVKNELHADYVSIFTVPGLDCRPYKWTGYNLSAIYNYAISLKGGLDDVWGRFDKEIRWGIKKAEGCKISVEAGGREEVTAIYDLTCQRYEEQGKYVPVPKRYILDVYEAFRPNLNVLAAKCNGEVKSGLISICYKERHIAWLGITKTDMQKVSPNCLLVWESIKIAHGSGKQSFELLGAAGVKRLSKYYDAYNPDLVLSFSATKYNSPKAKVMEQVYLSAIKPVRDRIRLNARGRG